MLIQIKGSVFFTDPTVIQLMHAFYKLTAKIKETEAAQKCYEIIESNENLSLFLKNESLYKAFVTACYIYPDANIFVNPSEFNELQKLIKIESMSIGSDIDIMWKKYLEINPDLNIFDWYQS